MVISIHIASWLINNVNLHVNTFNILQDTNNMSSSPSFCGICDIVIFLNHQKFGVQIVMKDFAQNASTITV